jgi:DNA-binding transcriptional LysR family regulator
MRRAMTSLAGPADQLGGRQPGGEGGLRVDDVASLVAFVSAGLGLGILPARAIVLPPDLTAVELDPGAQQVIALAWHRERPPCPRALRFVELAQSVAAKLARRPLLRAM